MENHQHHDRHRHHHQHHHHHQQPNRTPLPDDNFLIRMRQVVMSLVLFAAFLITAGLPSWLLLFYDRYIPRADFTFLDPLAWLCLMWVRQAVRWVVEEFVVEDWRQHAQRVFSITYLVIVVVNAVCGLVFLPQFKDNGPHSPQSQQLLGFFFVVVTFFMLEAKWTSRKTIFGSKFRGWNKNKRSLELTELLGELKLVGVVTATLIGGLVRESQCLTDGHITNTTHPVMFFGGDDHESHPCRMVYTESAIVYIWLWFLFFDLALARVASSRTYYNVAATVAGLTTFAEHILLMADSVSETKLNLIFGSARRGTQLIVMLVVLFEGDRRITARHEDFIPDGPCAHHDHHHDHQHDQHNVNPTNDDTYVRIPDSDGEGQALLAGASLSQYT